MADTVIVTGASRGIGAAIAAELDRRGFAVAVAEDAPGLGRIGIAAIAALHAADRRRAADEELGVREALVIGSCPLARDEVPRAGSGVGQAAARQH